MSATPEILPLALSKGILVHPTAPNVYLGTVSADFCYASALALPTAHGGYIGSIILQAIHTHFQTIHPTLNQPDVFTVQFRFLEASNAGPISITITDTKLSKNTSTVHFAASQSQTLKIVGYATQFNASARINTGFSFPTPPLLDPLPRTVDFRKLASNTDPNWIVHSTPYHPAHKVKSQTQCRYALPRAGMPSPTVSDGWIAPIQPGERFTNVSLGWLADQWPQGVPDYRPEGPGGREEYGLLNTPKGIWRANMWYPTLTMDVELKKPLPVEGVEWVFVRSRATGIRDGRMALEVWVFDMGLEIVAVSHHVCFVIELKGGKRGTKL
jgi:hypothetical protein